MSQNSPADNVPYQHKIEQMPSPTVPFLFRDLFPPDKTKETPKPPDVPQHKEEPLLTDEHPVSSGSNIERLTRYMKGEYGQFYKKPDGTRVADPGLMRFDADRDWQLSKSEIDVAMSAKVNKDELRMLAWMGKNLGALENLGDQKPGFSRADLDVFSQMKEHGTGGWSNTTRNVDWTAIGAASALTTAVVPKLLRVPMNPLRFATLAAVSIVSDVVIKAGWYTYIERPKIDTAIEELNSLPAVNKSK